MSVIEKAERLHQWHLQEAERLAGFITQARDIEELPDDPAGAAWSGVDMATGFDSTRFAIVEMDEGIAAPKDSPPKWRRISEDNMREIVDRAHRFGMDYAKSGFMHLGGYNKKEVELALQEHAGKDFMVPREDKPSTEESPASDEPKVTVTKVEVDLPLEPMEEPAPKKAAKGKKQSTGGYCYGHKPVPDDVKQDIIRRVVKEREGREEVAAFYGITKQRVAAFVRHHLNPPAAKVKTKTITRQMPEEKPATAQHAEVKPVAKRKPFKGVKPDYSQHNVKLKQ